MSKNLFNSIRVKKPNSSFIDLTHDVKMSGNFGVLMPCLAMDVLPGDRLSLGCDLMARCQPMLAPIMHRADVYVHYYFVPNRILWPNWEKFITGSNENPPGDYPTPAHPYIETNDFGTAQWELADYLGIPPNGDPTLNPRMINALPFAAYNKIFQDYYADQNYETAMFGGNNIPGTELVDGENDATDFFLRNRAWEHDRFTSALPWAQKGEVVTIPTELTDVNVRFNSPNVPGGTNQVDTNTGLLTVGGATPVPPLTGTLFSRNSQSENLATINDLRRAYALQRWLEKAARAGTRYVESLLVHFGVRSSDKRLQRAEYITGIKSPLIISEVLSTAYAQGTGEGDVVPQGNMAGHGISVSGGKVANYFVEEHGWVIGILSALPKTAYQQGLDKKFTRSDRYDYFWADFEHLGEEPVLLEEIYAYTANFDQVWGYTPRYSDYKYMYSRVAGEFRTNLAFWHMGRIFSSEPVMSEDFIKMKPADVSRVFAVEEESDQLLFHVLNKIGARRPMSNYGTPI